MITKIIIVPKLSKLDWDKEKLKLSHQEVIEWYQKAGIDSKKIVESHFRQQEVLQRLEKLLGNPKTIHRDKLSKELIKEAKIVVALGGDGHFTFVSHFVNDQILVGINSDPLTSVGALLNYSIYNLDQLAQKVKEGKLEVMERTRIGVDINGQTLPYLASSELYIGERDRLKISRYIISKEGLEEEQKSAGLIIATGAGMGGWFNSVSKGDQKPLGVSERALRFVASEIYDNHQTVKYQLALGEIKEGERLKVKSLFRDDGIVAVDSLAEFVYPLPAGSLAEVYVSKKTLKVLK